MLDPTYRPRPRRRFIEFHEQAYTPGWIRKPVQQLLTIAWTVCFYPLQSVSPAELSAEILSEVLQDLELSEADHTNGTKYNPVGANADGQTLIGLRKRTTLDGHSDEQTAGTAIVDFCSGAGGPLPTIERVLNERRLASHLPPIPFLLTDLYPATSHWIPLAASSPTKSLKYVRESVDATRASRAVIDDALRTKRDNRRTKQFRTFFLAFHHFDEESSIRVLEDAMRPVNGSSGGGADGVGIFELQTFNVGSIAAINLLWPMSWVVTPFLRPSLTQLIFTYLIPIIPFILVFDGYISAYRSRPPQHIEYLGNVALGRIRQKLGPGVEVDEWEWTSGVKRHTWPAGEMYYTVGTRRKREEA